MPSLEAESLCFFTNGSQFGKAFKTNDAITYGKLCQKTFISRLELINERNESSCDENLMRVTKSQQHSLKALKFCRVSD